MQRRCQIVPPWNRCEPLAIDGRLRRRGRRFITKQHDFQRKREKKRERKQTETSMRWRELVSRGISDEEDGDTSRRSLDSLRISPRFSKKTFKEHNTLNPKQKLALAKQLNLRPRQVEVWFQNRRARTKLKQTEVDCEFLKRCCENLTEENRRLQKERVAVPPPSSEARSHQMATTHHRPIPINPWATATPIPHRPFDALHPRS
ncbi:Homeobox-leucine zipper protein HAT4 [Vitis vinifera]|uniref:Homeobox-leucine zipper protein HAT4 n=1 Tax=Vitis vinifera TaxID=29760 RepID=A0A438ESN5_VITVI|nr:Homeobox-leucine zipper protein HAT4 [Vitis vinifera]